MRDFPQELLFALVFGAVWLAQLLYKLARRKAATPPSDDVPAPAPVPTLKAENDRQAPPAGLRPTRQGLQAPAANLPTALEAPGALPAALAAEAVPSASRLARGVARPLAHRFSKAALMPDRRAVQDAIVIAAILQPCHAQRPHDVG